MPRPWGTGIGSKPAAQDARQLIDLVSRFADDIHRNLYEVGLVGFTVDLHRHPTIGQIGAFGTGGQKQNWAAAGMAHLQGREVCAVSLSPIEVLSQAPLCYFARKLLEGGRQLSCPSERRLECTVL